MLTYLAFLYENLCLLKYK